MKSLLIDGYHVMRTSHSEMETFANCPHRWELSYLKNWWPPYKGKALIQGIALHETFDIAIKEVKREKRSLLDVPKDEFEKWGIDLYQKEINKHIETAYPHEREKIINEIGKAIPMYSAFYDFAKWAKIDRFPGESESNKVIRINDKFAIYGGADYIEPGRMIFDWKGLSQAKKHLPEDYALQIGIYCLVYNENRGAIVVFVKNSDQYCVLDTTVTDRRKLYIRAYINNMLTQMVNGPYPAQGMRLTQGFGRCFWCPYYPNDVNRAAMGPDKLCKKGVV